MIPKVVGHSLWSGGLAATASVFGKLAMSGSLDEVGVTDWQSLVCHI